jgi:hypothetical protein
MARAVTTNDAGDANRRADSNRSSDAGRKADSSHSGDAGSSRSHPKPTPAQLAQYPSRPQGPLPPRIFQGLATWLASFEVAAWQTLSGVSRAHHDPGARSGRWGEGRDQDAGGAQVSQERAQLNPEPYVGFMT